MKEKLIAIYGFLVAGLLGIWSLAFMASPALLVKTQTASNAATAMPSIYDSLFMGELWEGAGANIAASIFWLLIIILSAAFVALAVVKLLTVYQVKIPFAEKLDAKLFKKYDLVSAMIALYILLNLIAMICMGAFASKNTVYESSANYVRVRVGFAPVWLLISSITALAAVMFKDKILSLGESADTVQTEAMATVAEESAEQSAKKPLAINKIKKAKSKKPDADLDLAVQEKSDIAQASAPAPKKPGRPPKVADSGQPAANPVKKAPAKTTSAAKSESTTKTAQPKTAAAKKAAVNDTSEKAAVNEVSEKAAPIKAPKAETATPAKAAPKKPPVKKAAAAPKPVAAENI